MKEIAARLAQVAALVVLIPSACAPADASSQASNPTGSGGVGGTAQGTGGGNASSGIGGSGTGGETSGSGGVGGDTAGAGGSGGMQDAGDAQAGAGGRFRPDGEICVFQAPDSSTEGKEFIPRGFGVGEWRNLESYMLEVATPDVRRRAEQTEDDARRRHGQANAEKFSRPGKRTSLRRTRGPVGQLGRQLRPLAYQLLVNLDGRRRVHRGRLQAHRRLRGLVQGEDIYVILDLHAAPGCAELRTHERLPGRRGAASGRSPRPIGSGRLIPLASPSRKGTPTSRPLADSTSSTSRTIRRRRWFSSPPGTGALRPFYIDITEPPFARSTPSHILFFEGSNWSSEAAGASRAFRPSMGPANWFGPSTSIGTTMMPPRSSPISTSVRVTQPPGLEWRDRRRPNRRLGRRP